MIRRTLIALATISALLIGTTAMAVPTLQLGIWDPIGMTYVGTYDTTTDTTVADSSQFVLRALLADSTKLSLTHYISFALSPKTEVGGDYGSIGVAGTTYDVTNDLTYGTPPISAVDSLGPHGIFPTYFGEHAFDFVETDTTGVVNVETKLPEGSPGDFLYYVDFNIDLSNLLQGYVIHFDLYNTNVLDGTYTLGDFAPFSHDAEGGGTAVPEPATLALMGIGSAMMVGVRRRRNRK